MRKFSYRLIAITSVSLAIAFGSTSISAQETDNSSRPSRAVQAYAKSYKVSPEEAQRRLTAQREVGTINEKLEMGETDTFGGLYIEHTPVHRVVVKFTNNGEATLHKYTQNPLFVALPASISYKQLVDTQTTVYATLKALGIDSASRVDVVTSRLEFYVDDPSAVQTLTTAGSLKIPEFVDIKRALNLNPQREATIEGGRALSGGNCTAGFTVYNTVNTSQRFILTAGHCGTPMTYNGVTLPRQGVNYTTNSKYDYQWHTTPSFDKLTNVIYEGFSSYYRISSVHSYAAMAVGDWVCKYGNATGYSCGQITSKNYNLLGAGGFVQIHDPDNYNMSSGGDSGGPYYDDYTYPNSAWGSHSDSAKAVNPNDSVFMPISYISASNLAVLTRC